MDAVILAAGLGTRLRPHTLRTPKPLLPVQGRPILDWTLGALPPVIRRVVVVVNYLADQIEAYLNEQTHFADWTTVRQENPRGTGDAFRCCKNHLRSDRCLVLNGDDLYGAADLEELVRHPAAILVQKVEQARQWGVAFLKPDGTVERLVEKPDLDGPALGNLGAYVFPRTVLDWDLPLSPRGEYEITDYVTLLARTQAVVPVEARFWLPIGSIEAWHRAELVDLSPLQRNRLLER
ncbi:MAG: nucleotidyltransferase family protein [Gemmatales bacterium]|nr:nucleotidyltransferase family protein [Gemmatales bacterium]MDW8387452.1 nucleotidyltransferase family protein [Gemmatales bacterium]